MPRAQTQEFMRAAISWITSSPSIDLNACGKRMLFIVRDFLGLSAETWLWLQKEKADEKRTAINGHKATVERPARLTGKPLKEGTSVVCKRRR